MALCLCETVKLNSWFVETLNRTDTLRSLCVHFYFILFLLFPEKWVDSKIGHAGHDLTSGEELKK